MRSHDLSLAELRQIDSRMHQVSLQIASQVVSPTCSLLISCCNYVLNRIKRIVEWGEQEHVYDADLIGYSCRCIFEASLMLSYYGKMKNPVVRMKAEVLFDDYEILKSSVAFLGCPTLETQEIFEELEKRHQPKSDKTPSYRHLAEASGWESEYDSFYKLYSKYAHPSAYYLLADHRVVHAAMVRDIFLDRAVVYSNYVMLEMDACLAAVNRASKENASIVIA